MLRFMATRVKARDVKAGDLLSTQGQEHWDTVPSHKCSCDSRHPIMARIMVAVNEEPEADEDVDTIYRITLHTDDESAQHPEDAEAVESEHGDWGDRQE